MQKVVYLFPGQGAQYVGMGQDLYEEFDCVREVFERANRLLGYDLASICFSGPEEKLNSTALSQVAIFVTSIAVWEVFEKEVMREEKCFAAAGLSLG
jgi:[acyl-carrier-protein] S-malonyltransferase